MTQKGVINFLGDYINGEFVRSKRPDGQWQGKSPANLKDEVATVEYTYEHVETACAAAKEAHKTWRKLSFDERKNYLLRLKEVYSTHKHTLL